MEEGFSNGGLMEKSSLRISGYIFSENSFLEATVIVEDGKISSIRRGVDHNADFKGILVPRPHNAHVHILDVLIKDKTEERDLLKLVAPPNGIKHKMLSSATIRELKDALRYASMEAEEAGLGLITEFRELGARGALLGKPTKSFRVLSRPSSIDEAKKLIDISDGFNISAISDVDIEFAKELARIARSKGKIFGMHASEIIREDIDTILDLNPDFLVHMSSATEHDLDLVIEEEVPIVICPRSNAYFGVFPNVEYMIKNGARVLIGTDNIMINSMDVFREAEFLFKFSKAIGQNIAALDIIKMLFRDFKEDWSIKEGTDIKSTILIKDLRGKPEIILINRTHPAKLHRFI